VRELVGDQRLQRGRDHVAHMDAVVDAAVEHLVAADRELDQLRGHWPALLVHVLPTSRSAHAGCATV
jgi:hypothetical protein